MARNGTVFTPKKTQDYERLIVQAYRDQSEAYFESYGLHMQVDVFVRTKVRGDFDNYLKIASDALNKIAYKDDKSITHGHVYIHQCQTDEEMRMEIQIWDGDEEDRSK